MVYNVVEVHSYTFLHIWHVSFHYVEAVKLNLQSPFSHIVSCAHPSVDLINYISLVALETNMREREGVKRQRERERLSVSEDQLRVRLASGDINTCDTAEKGD